MDEDDLEWLLKAARDGDQGAWNALVERFQSLLWSVARSFRLGADDAADVVQTVWMRLAENLDRIEDPRRLAGWLLTTTRRECLQQLRRAGRERPSSVPEWLEEVPDADGRPPDGALLERERDAELWRAFGRLKPQCQQILRVLMASPPPSYAEAAVVLGMPIGSIGPLRQRCLATLRRLLEDGPEGLEKS